MCSSLDLSSVLCNFFFFPERKRRTTSADRRNDKSPKASTANKRGFMLEGEQELINLGLIVMHGLLTNS